MEVFQTDNYYIFVKREKSLWWHRHTSEFSIKAGWDLSSVDDIECIGITHGIIGVITLQGVYEPHLVIIKEAIPIGVLYPPHLVYKIKSVCVLSSEDPDSLLTPCTRHNHSRINSASSSPQKSRNIFEGNQLMNKTWGAVKIAGNTIKNTTQQAAQIASKQVKSTVGIRDPLRISRKITEELHKIFDETDSFYFCFDSDVTNNLQRRDVFVSDERFFWNKHMIEGITVLNDKTWILPVIQGFVQVEQCVIGNDCFTLALVSRRSRHRAGTRYKRRGVDENGDCANYVETEQILSFRHHQLCFTQVRGSVPVFWSQPGYKYRPPPRIDRDEIETQAAFEKHFQKELSIYDGTCIVNLVEQTGKEKVIGDAYARHIIKYNSDKLIYVTFDFHDYCRGMRFENVSALIEALGPEAGAMGFHWRDQRGVICNQKSVFRVNCMDCLDRTNVVQTALGKAVLESQLVKLGLAPPYTPIPDQLKAPFMLLWANNGDIISRQYAGTNALKGDYTRTGERKLAGMVKDGMNSANRFIIQTFADSFRQSVIDLMHGKIEHADDIKGDDVWEALLNVAQQTVIEPLAPDAPPKGYYNPGVLGAELKLLEPFIFNSSYYLARFKDSYRQATIDLMLGNQVSSESLNALGGQTAPDEVDAAEGAEHAKLLVEDCRRLLLGTAQFPIGAWGLIDADPVTGDISETEVDTILLLTDECYIVAEYDSHLDKIIRFEKVPLDNLILIELGTYQQTKIFQGSSPVFSCLRLNYSVDGQDGYFHMFRSANIRFFNNVVEVIKTQEEILESLQNIVEFFNVALDSIGKKNVKVSTGGTLQRRKSKIPTLDVPKGMPRNHSESQLIQISSKAISNVAGQFSKLGQSFHVKGKTRQPDSPKVEVAVEAGMFTVGSGNKLKLDSTSSDSEENDSSIYEPDIPNDFLPSVGIVMSSSVPENPDPKRKTDLVDKSNFAIMSEDVSSFSISSVTDNVTFPTGLLENNVLPSRSISPNPEIKIEDPYGQKRPTSSTDDTRSVFYC
ncbi:INPP5F family protein [Megaselia abdita]